MLCSDVVLNLHVILELGSGFRKSEKKVNFIDDYKIFAKGFEALESSENKFPKLNNNPKIIPNSP